MGKTPKQYRRRDGDVTPEKIDIDEELERQYSRANRAKSSEDEKQRLERARDARKEEREKGILLCNPTLESDSVLVLDYKIEVIRL